MFKIQTFAHEKHASESQAQARSITLEEEHHARAKPWTSQLRAPWLSSTLKQTCDIVRLILHVQKRKKVLVVAEPP